MTSKVWLITGASRGLGRVWAEAALERGDRVAATARRVEDVEALRERFGERALPLRMDVTDGEQVVAAVAAAETAFGRLDVVVNNAGYSLVGTVEEAGTEEVARLFDTNLLGTMRVLQAVLPGMRARGGGHLVGVSSVLGLIGIPLLGLYSASKWAFEGVHEALAAEVRPFGIRVTILEPGAYATEFGSAASVKVTPGMEAYAGLRSGMIEAIRNADKGDPGATPGAVMEVVDAEVPPLRMFVGSTGLPRLRTVYAARLAEWEAWAAVADGAQGAPMKGVLEM